MRTWAWPGVGPANKIYFWKNKRKKVTAWFVSMALWGWWDWKFVCTGTQRATLTSPGLSSICQGDQDGLNQREAVGFVLEPPRLCAGVIPSYVLRGHSMWGSEVSWCLGNVCKKITLPDELSLKNQLSLCSLNSISHPATNSGVASGLHGQQNQTDPHWLWRSSCSGYAPRHRKCGVSLPGAQIQSSFDPSLGSQVSWCRIAALVDIKGEKVGP